MVYCISLQHTVCVDINVQLYTVYYVSFSGVKCLLFSLSSSQQNILQHQIFILDRNISAKIPNSEISATKICPNTENSETFT